MSRIEGVVGTETLTPRTTTLHPPPSTPLVYGPRYRPGSLPSFTSSDPGPIRTELIRGDPERLVVGGVRGKDRL